MSKPEISTVVPSSVREFVLEYPNLAKLLADSGNFCDWVEIRHIIKNDERYAHIKDFVHDSLFYGIKSEVKLNVEELLEV